MAKREFVARPASMINDEDAKVVGPELERLAKEGRCNPDGIVGEASEKSSPLHPYFDWDDSTAAHRYRKWEARQLSKAVEVRVTINGKQRLLPLLISVGFEVPDPEDADETIVVRTYQTPNQIKKHPSMVHSVIEDARRDLLSVTRRYRQYLEMFTEFSDEYKTLFETINDLEPEKV